MAYFLTRYSKFATCTSHSEASVLPLFSTSFSEYGTTVGEHRNYRFHYGGGISHNTKSCRISLTMNRRFDFLWNLHPAESFPLLLGLFILIQQFSFVAIQAKALKSVFIQDCRVSSQVVFTREFRCQMNWSRANLWLEIFVVGYIHFIFGLEMTIRSLRRTRFTPRPKYTTAVCTVIVLIMCILTWLSTRLRMPRNTCFGDLIWRSIRSAPLGVVICTFLIPSFIIMAAIIALQLRRTVNVEPDERIAGTRMVYYLLLSAVLYVGFRSLSEKNAR
jgi:hypothetical protein